MGSEQDRHERELDRALGHGALGAIVGGALIVPAVALPLKTAALVYACAFGACVGVAAHAVTKREQLPPLERPHDGP